MCPLPVRFVGLIWTWCCFLYSHNGRPPRFNEIWTWASNSPVCALWLQSLKRYFPQLEINLFCWPLLFVNPLCGGDHFLKLFLNRFFSPMIEQPMSVRSLRMINRCNYGISSGGRHCGDLDRPLLSAFYIFELRPVVGGGCWTTAAGWRSATLACTFPCLQTSSILESSSGCAPSTFSLIIFI